MSVDDAAAYGPDSGSEVEATWVAFTSYWTAWFRRRLPKPEDADDLVQETFLRVHSGLADLRERDKLTPWIRRIANNLLTDHLRRGGPAASSLDDEGVENDASHAAAAEGDDEIDRIVASWLEPMATDLDPSDRDALLLFERDGLSAQEIASQLGLSVSGAKSRVQRARGKLRALLSACCHFEFDRLGGVIDYERRVKSSCGPCGPDCAS